jgi:hypothetical protein
MVQMAMGVDQMNIVLKHTQRYELTDVGAYLIKVVDLHVKQASKMCQLLDYIDICRSPITAI